MTIIQINPAYRDVKPKGFYVYIHRRATNGKEFYVGKGSADRGWHKSRYARKRGWWISVARKHGVSIDIVQDNMSESDAFLLEMWLIAKLRHVGLVLCNLTNGGEGPSGTPMKEETKKILSEAKTGERNHMYGKKHSEETRRKMSASRFGAKPALGMRHTEEVKLDASKRFSGDGNPVAKREVYEFWHKDHGKILATTAHMRQVYGLSNPIRHVATGRSLSCKGWRLHSRKDEVGYDFSKNCKKVMVFTSLGESYETMSEAAREMVILGHEKATQSAIWYACKTPGRIAFGREWFRTDGSEESDH